MAWTEVSLKLNRAMRSPLKSMCYFFFRKSFAAGGAASALGAAVFFFAPDKTQSPVGSASAVTIACMLMGVGGTGLMVGAVSLQADLVGVNTNCGSSSHTPSQ
jgi:hypothetical protein